jgi:hypothetical protein
VSQKQFMVIVDPAGRSGEPLLWAQLDAAGDEAVLPAGTCLSHPARPGRLCFLLIDGAAVVQYRSGATTRVASGSFIGTADPEGRPSPLSDVTVRLARDSRVMVFDVGRLAALLVADETARGAWNSLMGR